MQFALAGRYWRIADIDRSRQRVFVEPATGSSSIALILRVAKRTDVETLRAGLADLGEQELTNADLVAVLDVPRLEKYDEFIPEALLRRAYASDRLDLPTALAALQA